MSSAITPPQIYKAVNRQRLFDLLDQNYHRQNTLIIGQAAQGKSTLAASYLKTKVCPVLWLSLSEEDDNHTKLYDKISHGIIAIFGEKTGAQRQIIPRSTLGAQKKGLRHLDGLSALLHAVQDDLIIVLDDLQRIDEQSSGFMMIRHLVHLRIDHLKIYLLSRQLPDLDLVQLKIKQHLYIIDNEMLAFNPEETRSFFEKQQAGQTVDIKKIYKLTNGWAGGLTLISESIRQSMDLPSLSTTLSADAFSFFSNEIYSRLDEETKNFLVKATILDTIDIEAARLLTGNDNCLDILDSLEKRNLFIQRIITDKGKSVYKLHDLFKQFLANDLATRQDKPSIDALNRKAGKYFWENKDHEQAIDYFLKAGAFEDIKKIIRIKGTDYVIRGKMAEPEKWIAQIPVQMINDDPWLLFFKTMTQRINGGKKNIARLKDAFSLFDQDNDIRGMLLCTGFLIEAAVFIRQPSDRILGWIGLGEDLLLRLKSSHRYPWAKAMLWQQIGLGYIAGNGNIPKGVSACQNAIILGKQIQNQELIVNASITMTFGHVQSGDFIRAGRILSDIEDMAHRDQHPEYRALKTIVDIELTLKKADFKTSKIMLDQSEKDIEKFGLIFLYPGFVEEKTHYLIYTGQFDQARQMADHLNDFSILDGNDFYNGISKRIKALIDLKQGRFKAATQNIEMALDQLDKAKKGEIHHFLAKQIEGAIFFETGQLTKARASLGHTIKYFSRISSGLSFAETALLLGLTCWELKDREKGTQHLLDGLKKICQENYHFFPLLSTQTLSRSLLILAQDNSLKKNHMAKILELIPSCGKKEVFKQINRLLEQTARSKKMRAISSLRPIYKHLIPKLKIKTLGEFSIYRGSESIDTASFGGTKPVLLFKSIIFHGANDIPKEILIDDLWPDSTASSGEKNLKINLYRLRKAIEPMPEKDFGYSYLIQKSGLISIDPDLVKIDAEDFIALSSRGARFEKENRNDLAIDCYHSATLLYKGMYFAEEPYMDWLQRKRELYRSKLIDLLRRKARLHEEMEQPAKAIASWQALLEEDPYFEIAYQNLMILYADTGQKPMALDLFVRCKERLHNELGVEPDRQTIQIHQDIFNSMNTNQN